MEAQTQVEQKRYTITPTAAPEAIIIRCYDPRFQEPIDLFLKEELGLPRGSYVDLGVAGGVASLSEQLRLPKDFKFMKDNAKLALSHFKTIRRAILINHEDCAKYKAMTEVLRLVADKMPERQRDDLATVMPKIVEIASRNIEVRRFYAKFANPARTEVIFEELK